MGESTFERSPRPPSMSGVRSRGARFAVRGLVIAGFAGVAWLLSASVAHAADSEPAGAGFPGGVVTGLVGTLSGDASDNREHGGTKAVLTTAKYLVVTSATRLVADGATQRGDRTRGGLSPRVETVLDPVTNTVTSVTATSPVALVTAGTTSDLGRVITSTITDTSAELGEPLIVGAHGRTIRVIDNSSTFGADEDMAGRSGSPSVPIDAAATTGVGLVGVDPAGLDPAGTEKGGSPIHGAADRWASSTAEHTGSISGLGSGRFLMQRTHHVPLPRPAPLPAYPAAGSTPGTPSTGSGCSHDGGTSATVTAGPPAGTVIEHESGSADDVEVRLETVESPTVSPD